jgi:TonB-linked SusC/RagA family outer membrane protein
LPLPAATVLVKGTSNGTSTDFDGNYSITANIGDVLQFSYVGYSTVEAQIGESKTISLALSPDNTLEEVVITALGIERKPDEITTSTQNVKAEELTQAKNPDIVSSLAGKVSGLQINQTSNGIGSDTRIVLRGNRSITGNNEALVVIDGVISSAGFLSSLNPDSIESVNVIKGANGAALYGSAGSNGALIVTTKKGSKSEKFTVQVQSTATFESVSYLPERQTKYGQGWFGQNYTYENGAWGPEFDGELAPVGLPQANGEYIYRPYESLGDDNIKEYFQTGTTYLNSIAVSSGDKDGYFNLGAQNQRIKFVIENDEAKRNNFTFRGGKTIGKLSASVDVAYTEANNQSTTGDIYRDLLQAPTNVLVSQFENYETNAYHWNGYYENPYWKRENNRRDNLQSRFNFSSTLKYDFNKNISALIRTNSRNFLSNTRLTANAYTEPDAVIAITGFPGRTKTSSLQVGSSSSRVIYNDVIVNFDYMLSEDVSFKANVGHNIVDSKSVSQSFFGENLTQVGDLASANLFTSNPQVTDTRTRNRRIGVFANLDFGYKDYLFLNLTGRNDWNSILPKGNNSFFYPSAGVSFIPTKAFPELKGNVLSNAKLTASIVKVGGTGSINTYGTNVLASQAAGFPLGGNSSYLVSSNVTNPNITPEFTTSVEFGANLGFLKNRLTLDASYFSSKNTDQIAGIGTSYASGLNNATLNIGETKTEGFEIDLGGKIIDTKNFDWNARVSYSTNETTVVKLSDNAKELALLSFEDFGVFAVEGQEFPLIKGSAYRRDPQGRVVIGANGTPEVSSTFQDLGNTTPDYILGFSTGFRYKNLTLNAVADYRTGHVFWTEVSNHLAFSGYDMESTQTGRRGFVYPNSVIETSPGVFTPNTSVITGGTTYENFVTYYTDQYTDVAENSVYDASAFRIREISLGYTFNKELLKSTGISDLTLTLIARNPFLITPDSTNQIADPEFSRGTSTANQGINTLGNYPTTRTIGLNASITF